MRGLRIIQGQTRLQLNQAQMPDGGYSVRPRASGVVEFAVVLVDREEGGCGNIEAKGIW